MGKAFSGKKNELLSLNDEKARPSLERTVNLSDVHCWGTGMSGCDFGNTGQQYSSSLVNLLLSGR